MHNIKLYYFIVESQGVKMTADARRIHELIVKSLIAYSEGNFEVKSTTVEVTTQLPNGSSITLSLNGLRPIKERELLSFTTQTIQPAKFLYPRG